MKDKSKDVSNRDYRALLIKLGISEELLLGSNLDFAFLYQKLYGPMSANRRNALKCTEAWQLQILGDKAFDYEVLKNQSALQDNKGATALHYLAWSGNTKALDWIKANDPHAWELKDNRGRTLYHYIAWSGKTKALDWINANAPQAWELKNYCGRTPLDYTALSGDPEILNQALSQKINPNTWSLYRINALSQENKKIFFSTLLTALKSNYHLTDIYFPKNCGIEEKDRLSISLSLSRNSAIKQANVSFIAFLQGLNQPNSNVSWLLGGGLETYELILAKMLPEGVDVNRVFKENHLKIDNKNRISIRHRCAIEKIDAEIARLIPSNHENNTFWDFSLEIFHLSSDSKIAALQALKMIAEAGGDNMPSKIEEWKDTYTQVIKTHRNKVSSFFALEPSKSEVAVDAILKLLENKSSLAAPLDNKKGTAI